MTNKNITQKAIFAAGCFWGVEEAFFKIKGVTETRVGYTGGTTPNPTYEQVCSNKTGHAEAIEITFNPDKVPYLKLLDIFWQIHDPTTLNSQGPDFGTQYRSAIYYLDNTQKQEAEKSKKQLEESKKYKNLIVTEITPAKEFYPAEDYHQKYFLKNPNYSCPID